MATKRAGYILNNLDYGKRSVQIQSRLKPATQPQAENSDRLAIIQELMEELAESGDLVALMQMTAYSNALAQRVMQQ